jgi:hypothetical protein
VRNRSQNLCSVAGAGVGPVISKQGSRSACPQLGTPLITSLERPQKSASAILRSRPDVWIFAVRMESKAGGSGTLVRLT